MPKRKSKKLPLAMPNDNYEYVSFVTNDRAVWNYEDEDFVYFDGVISEICYGN